MKIQHKAVALIACLAALAGCTKQNVNDTGITSPYFDGNMMEYFRNNPANWELTVEMIEHAGLTQMIEGNDPDYPKITFFAPTTYSVMRYVWDNGKESVTEFTQQECRDILLKHIVKGKHLKESFGVLDKNYTFNNPLQTGVTDLTCEYGNVLRVYQMKTDFGNVKDMGPVTMHVYSLPNPANLNTAILVPLASPDIQPANGVVHALDYKYVLNKL